LIPNGGPDPTNIDRQNADPNPLPPRCKRVRRRPRFCRVRRARRFLEALLDPRFFTERRRPALLATNFVLRI